MEMGYLSLDKLEAYKLARALSKIAWGIYEKHSWQDKKIMGDQFVESTDSTGGNIAEGYGRFHYLDKIKFYYNARGSLLESRHWFELLDERGKLGKTDKDEYMDVYKKLRPVLNGLIRSAYKEKKS